MAETSYMNIRIPTDIAEVIKRMAEAAGVSRQQYIEEVLHREVQHSVGPFQQSRQEIAAGFRSEFAELAPGVEAVVVYRDLRGAAVVTVGAVLDVTPMTLQLQLASNSRKNRDTEHPTLPIARPELVAWQLLQNQDAREVWEIVQHWQFAGAILHPFTKPPRF